MLEVGVDHTVGESFATNTDTFKYTVTCQLVHNQVRIDDTCGATKITTTSVDRPFGRETLGVQGESDWVGGWVKIRNKGEGLGEGI